MNITRSIVIQRWGWIALSLVVLLSPAAARADCNGQWDLSGYWSFNQGGAEVEFDLTQTGNTISGTGRFNRKMSAGAFHESIILIPIEGDVRGTTTGKTFSFAVTWSGGSVGEYSGAMDENGWIRGTTFDQNNQGVNVDWQGDHAAKCSTVAAAHCPSGYVWRDTFDGDSLCVKPDERHRLANGTCSSGYVWRDTFDGDNVCVTPAQRTAAKAQKRRDELGEVTNRPGASAMGVPANPPAAPVPPPAAQMATANDDVDIYTGPGQEPITGMLAAGTKVPVLGHEPGWYKLKLNVPGGSGWVAEDHLTIGN